MNEFGNDTTSVDANQDVTSHTIYASLQPYSVHITVLVFVLLGTVASIAICCRRRPKVFPSVFPSV